MHGGGVGGEGVASHEVVTRRDRRCLALLRAGVGMREIARRYQVSLRTAYNGITRARLAERRSTEPVSRGPRLVLATGSSCRAMRLLRCEDVHPCRTCNARGCWRCKFTGISPIPRGSHVCCGVCHASGLDHLAALSRPPIERPAPRLAPAKAKRPRPTRRERRSMLEQLEPTSN